MKRYGLISFVTLICLLPACGESEESTEEREGSLSDTNSAEIVEFDMDENRLSAVEFNNELSDIYAATMESMDIFNRRAINMVTSPRARHAFDVSQEPDALRERYGRHEWGQRALLARRLVEAGVSWVTVVMERFS